MLQGKRVLVTGAHGFVGSHVMPKVVEYGCQVCAPTRSEYDLRDPRQTNSMFARLRPEVVVHLAADVGGIGYNQANPGSLFYNNAMMGINILEACRRYDVDKVVLVGTVCAYPKYTPVPFHEGCLWDGFPEETNAPYGIAKRMLLVQAQAYRAQYGLRTIYLMPVNLYGPRDNFDPLSSHVIPALIRRIVDAKILGSSCVDIWGSGNVTREFLYVDDAASAIVTAADRYEKAEPVNLGTGTEMTICALAEMLCELVGYSGNLTFIAGQPDGQPRRCLDVTRAKAEFGFIAKTSLRDGLRKTIEWYSSTLTARRSPVESFATCHE